MECLVYSHGELDSYLTDYFESYVQSEDVEKASLDLSIDAAQFADSLLEKPIIYKGEASSLVFIPAEGQGKYLELNKYCYFPCYEVKISKTNVIKYSMPKPDSLGLSHNIVDFPALNTNSKKSAVKKVKMRVSEFDRLTIKPPVELCEVEKIENPLLRSMGDCSFYCFTTTIPIVGNLALFNIVCNSEAGYGRIRYIESFPSLSFCNAAIAQGYRPNSSVYSGMPVYTISIPLFELHDSLNEEDIRRCQNEVIKRIQEIELYLKIAERKFNQKKVENCSAIVTRIESLRKARLDAAKDMQLKDLQAKSFRNLLNDF